MAKKQEANFFYSQPNSLQGSRHRCSEKKGICVRVTPCCLNRTESGEEESTFDICNKNNYPLYFKLMTAFNQVVRFEPRRGKIDPMEKVTVVGYYEQSARSGSSQQKIAVMTSRIPLDDWPADEFYQPVMKQIIGDIHGKNKHKRKGKSRKRTQVPSEYEELPFLDSNYVQKPNYSRSHGAQKGHIVNPEDHMMGYDDHELSLKDRRRIGHKNGLPGDEGSHDLKEYGTSSPNFLKRDRHINSKDGRGIHPRDHIASLDNYIMHPKNRVKEPDGRIRIPDTQFRDRNGHSKDKDHGIGMEEHITGPNGRNFGTGSPILGSERYGAGQDSFIRDQDGRSKLPDSHLINPDGRMDQDGRSKQPDSHLKRPDGHMDQDGRSKQPDGHLRRPEGRMDQNSHEFHPDDRIVRPDGCFLDEDGHMRDKDEFSKKKTDIYVPINRDGRIVRPDGLIIGPKGRLICEDRDMRDEEDAIVSSDEDSPMFYRDGHIICPDGIIIGPDGRIMDDGHMRDKNEFFEGKDGYPSDQDSPIFHGDGRITRPDGLIIGPDGRIMAEDEHMRGPGEFFKEKDGSIHKIPEATDPKDRDTINTHRRVMGKKSRKKKFKDGVKANTIGTDASQAKEKLLPPDSRTTDQHWYPSPSRQKKEQRYRKQHVIGHDDLLETRTAREDSSGISYLCHQILAKCNKTLQLTTANFILILTLFSIIMITITYCLVNRVRSEPKCYSTSYIPIDFCSKG